MGIRNIEFRKKKIDIVQIRNCVFEEKGGLHNSTQQFTT